MRRSTQRSISRFVECLLATSVSERAYASLLRAAGMEVEGPDVDDPAHLEARRPGGRLTLEVDVKEDRSAEWSVSGDGELDAGTKALALAGFLVRVLDTEPRGAHG